MKLKIFIPENPEEKIEVIGTTVSPLCIERLISDRSFEKIFNRTIGGKNGLARVV